MEDPLTGYMPSRSIVEEEEERQAQEYAESFSTPPVFEWSSSGRQLLHESKLHTQVLVLATSVAACSLLEQGLASNEVIGLIVQQEILQDAPVALRALIEGPTGIDAACRLYSLPGDGAAGGVMAVCKASVTQERAVAWVNELFANIQPRQIICLSALPAHSFMGKDDPTQDPLHFVLNTTAAIGKLHHDVPILPHGNLVTGLPAAVFSFCQVHDLPATLLLSVDAAPLPDGIAIRAYAQCTADVLQSTGAKAFGASLTQKEVLVAARKRAHSALQHADRAALYL